MPQQSRLLSSPALLGRVFGAGLLGLLGACAATEERSISQRVDREIEDGHYESAVRSAAHYAEEHPGDTQATDLHKRASLAWWIERGRQLTFADEDVQALVAFQKALDIVPDSAVAATWTEKTRHKLAERWLEAAFELHASEKLEPAIDAYENALHFEPGNAEALSGMASATLAVSFRAGLGRNYFEDGLHALSDYWLEQAQSRFSYAQKYQPADSRTNQRRVQVRGLLATQRTKVAQRFESQQRYGAARAEYRLALVLDAGNAEAKAGRERCELEVQAQRKLEDARNAMLRGNEDKAHKLLEEGQKLTLSQKDLFEGAHAKLQEAHNEHLYREAIGLERDFRYADAVEKYSALLAEAQYYKDVITRRDTLEVYIKMADERYAAAANETDDIKRLELLNEIKVFWPEYKDVAKQVAAIEARLPASTPPQSLPPAKPPPPTPPK